MLVWVGDAMEQRIVSLEAPGTDWTRLIRFVERSGQPLWIEADGEIHGVLLPSDQARRLLGYYTMEHDTETAAADILAESPRHDIDPSDARVGGAGHEQQSVKKIT